MKWVMVVMITIGDRGARNAWRRTEPTIKQITICRFLPLDAVLSPCSTCSMRVCVRKTHVAKEENASQTSAWLSLCFNLVNDLLSTAEGMIASHDSQLWQQIAGLIEFTAERGRGGKKRARREFYS